jgi:hypothetical protein
VFASFKDVELSASEEDSDNSGAMFVENFFEFVECLREEPFVLRI